MTQTLEDLQEEGQFGHAKALLLMLIVPVALLLLAVGFIVLVVMLADMDK